MKAILYGIGKYYEENKKYLPEDIEVVAFGDSSESNATSYTGNLRDGKRVLLPEEIAKEEFDVIILCPDRYIAQEIFFILQQYEDLVGKIRFLWRIKMGWKTVETVNGVAIVNVNDINIKQRYITDVKIVDEIFARREYAISILEKDTVVVDMGMNVGIASLYFASNKNVKRVYGYEPFKDTYLQALENFELNPDLKNKITPFNLALSDVNEQKVIYNSSTYSGYRSIFGNDNLPSGKEAVIECAIAGEEIKKIISENIDSKIILKIDTEGSEFAILESINKVCIWDKIDMIVMEYHREPQSLLDTLEKNNYRYIMQGEETIGLICAFSSRK